MKDGEIGLPSEQEKNSPNIRGSAELCFTLSITTAASKTPQSRTAIRVPQLQVRKAGLPPLYPFEDRSWLHQSSARTAPNRARGYTRPNGLAKLRAVRDRSAHTRLLLSDNACENGSPTAD